MSSGAILKLSGIQFIIQRGNTGVGRLKEREKLI